MIAAVPAAYRSSTAKRGNPLEAGGPGQAGRLVQVLRAFLFCLPFSPRYLLHPALRGGGAGTHPCPTQINRAVDPEPDELA